MGLPEILMLLKVLLFHLLVGITGIRAQLHHLLHYLIHFVILLK